MAYDLEEQEQLSALKAWWQQYGKLVIITVVGAALAIAGVRGWHYYKNQQASSAAVLFDQLLRAESGNDHKKVRDIAAQIVDNYGSTQYATLGALSAARSDFETGDLPAAKKRLQWVIEKAKEEEVRDVARLRLARVLLDEKNPAEALKQLETKHGESFTGLYAELKGDALIASGKPAEARAAYQTAFDKSDAASPSRQILQLKLDALGEAK
jgi:predicted negative regulator of RcsB-dependent stress response